MTKVAIVTASDSGIGKACALLLAQNGFDIGITGIPMNAARRRRRKSGAVWCAGRDHSS